MNKTFLIGLLILCSCSQVTKDKNANIATKGELDLRNYDFHRTVSLAGEWAFDWKNLNQPGPTNPKPKESFIRIGERWKKHFQGTGYATYQIKILFPEVAKKNIYALRFFQTGGAAMSIFIDGHLELELGKVGKTKEEMIPTRSSGTVLLPHPNAETNVLVHISNFYHDDGSFWYPPTLGSYKKINDQIFNESIRDALLTGALIFMAFYHFTVYFFRRHKTIIFYFGLYSLIIALHSISLNGDSLYFLFPDVPYRLAFSLSLIFYLAMPSYLLFLYQRFPENFSKSIISFFIITCTGLFIFVLVTPSELGSQTTFYGISLTIIGLFYSIICMFNAVFQKKDMAFPLLLIQIFLFLSAINDTLFLYGILDNFLILKYSYLSTVLFQSLVLASYFTKSFLKNEILGKELSLLNESLEKTVILRTEEYKEAKQIAEDANQWKDKFISLVAHDLRSPLSTVYSALTMITDKSSTEEENTHILKQVFVILENAMTTVEHLLNLNRFRIDKGQIHLHFSENNLIEIMRSLANSFSFELNKKSLQLDILLSETTTVYADTSLLIEILRNLIANAIKFSYPNGWVKVNAETNQEFTEIHIEDNGQGIPRERQTDLFSNPITSLGTMGEKGFGIGLKLCFELMRLHGGGIKVYSDGRTGSKFVLEFPNGSSNDKIS
ncbi:sensor histidine kinase [Leptospira sp. 85282-16]|uniref:sensor histidine kinase n=1 Tax=Leptospira sp. 85282-16 TaxID=2971256 RepID=UPI0021BEE614|nr:sensor histidine kinase [Leptospira sp. 85282-16]MCT8334816.1 sensor histidine kinase [Leptospira sp. 85282-16]